MLEVYWGLFVAGLVLAVLTVVFGELISGLLDGILDFLSVEGPGFMHPMTFVGGMTTLGGVGMMLTKGTSWGGIFVFVNAFTITLVICTLLYFAYIRPMRNAENSTSYSMQDLIGKIAEVSISIPVGGFGEVIVRAGAGHVNEIASSFDRVEIKSGKRVIIVDVEDGIVRVSPFDPDPLK